MLRMKLQTLVPTTLGVLLLACCGGQAPQEKLGSSAAAIYARSERGPALSYYDSPRRSDWTFMIFEGHNNDRLWHTRSSGSTWTSPAVISDGATPNPNVANSNEEPAAYAFTLPAITGGAAPRYAKHLNYVAFRGHDNNSIWLTRQPINEGYSSQWFGDWRAPRSISGTHSNHGPAITIHDWHNSTSNKVLIVAWTATDGTIKLKRSYEPTFPIDHSWPLAYRDITSIPSAYKSYKGPAIASVGRTLHVLFRGPANNKRIYHAVRPSGGSWSVSTVPSAYSNKAPSVTVHNGDIYMVFRGHNNKKLWVRHYDVSAGTWHNLGYVEGIETEQRPAIVSTGWYSFRLAFRSPDSSNTCVGTFYVDSSNAPDTAGHTWTRLSGSNCTQP